MFEIESGIPFPEEIKPTNTSIVISKVVQDDEFYGATSEQKRAYLIQRQLLPLSVKIRLTERRIQEWYEAHNGNVYVAFSGGKDSTVLIDIVRSIYPEVPAVFSDTGLEYPEIKEFVRGVENVTWLKPKKNFKQVIDEYGYPVISKTVSMAISRHNCSNDLKVKDYRLNGRINVETGKKENAGTIPKKYHFLINAPFKISESCCNYLKKNPFKVYEKETGRKPFIGTMADDSKQREDNYLKTGCNSFDQANPQSKPMGFWTEQDVLEYIVTKKLPYASTYGEIILKNSRYNTTGESNTGCIFCMFGIMFDKQPNRFQRMKLTHPQLHDYCINKLNLKQVLDYINVPYE